jgi:hypothetical protein
MPTPNLKRIAWFLNLQRILRFPRYRLAPSSIPPHYRQPKDDDGGVEPTTVIRNAQEHSTTATPMRVGTPRYQRLKREALSPLGVGPAKAPQRVFTAMSMSFRGSSTREVSWSPLSVVLGYPHSQSPAAGRRCLGSEGPTDQRPKGPGQDANIGFGYTSPKAWRNSARDVPRSHATFQRAPSPGTGRYSGVPSTLHPSLRAEPPPAGEISGTEQYSVEEFRHRSNNQDDFVGDEPLQHETSRTSTLHIDGSALGRWALQHLERALGRPTTGMTGVDPRASLPRSRVAPF